MGQFRCREVTLVNEGLKSATRGLIAARHGPPGGAQEPARIQVPDEYGTLIAVQHDVVGGFRADPLHVDEARAQFVGRQPRVGRVVEEPACCTDEGFGLGAHEAAGTDQALQVGRCSGRQFLRLEQAGFAQICQRILHIAPRHILRQDSTHHDLEAGVGRPPLTGVNAPAQRVKKRSRRGSGRCHCSSVA